MFVFLVAYMHKRSDLGDVPIPGHTGQLDKQKGGDQQLDPTKVALLLKEPGG